MVTELISSFESFTQNLATYYTLRSMKDPKEMFELYRDSDARHCIQQVLEKSSMDSSFTEVRNQAFTLFQQGIHAKLQSSAKAALQNEAENLSEEGVSLFSKFAAATKENIVDLLDEMADKFEDPPASE